MVSIQCNAFTLTYRTETAMNDADDDSRSLANFTLFKILNKLQQKQ
jgi:hypothetical protein